MLAESPSCQTRTFALRSSGASTKESGRKTTWYSALPSTICQKNRPSFCPPHRSVTRSKLLHHDQPNRPRRAHDPFADRPPSCGISRTRIGVDRAIIYGVLGTAQVFLTGPVTALIIAVSLTTEVQGYYYTFAALLALQVFVELGFAQVIMQFASHEWAHLRLRDDRSIEGDADAHSRLTSLARLSTTLVLALLRAARDRACGRGHPVLQRRRARHDVDWKGPWIAIAVLTADRLHDASALVAAAGRQPDGRRQLRAARLRAAAGPMLWGGLRLGGRAVVGRAGEGA